MYSVNRTVVELKPRYCSLNKFSGFSVNRTVVELKRMLYLVRKQRFIVLIVLL